MDTRKFAMNYGAYLGLALIAISFIVYILGLEEQKSILISLLSYFIIFIGIGNSLIIYKNNYNDEFLSYSKYIKIGTTVAFFASVIFAFYQLIYINFINTEFIENALKITEQEILNSNPEISDEELDGALLITERVLQPQFLFLLNLITITFQGFFISIIFLWFWGNWLLFEKANENGIYSLIPIYSLIVKLRMVGKPEWWILLLLIPFVNLIILFVVSNELRKCFQKEEIYALGIFLMPFIFQARLGINNDIYLKP
tara:strand:- start:55 stop:825 length:771 start_codon:yes stop_codon:yes gene_type:complete